MAFLDAFSNQQRDAFVSAAETMRLQRGKYLIRRGDPGGDVFVLQAGTLEVVDSRSSPEIILNTLGPGALIGEMAFVDDSPRSVDVRAATDTVVLRWGSEELRALLGKEPQLAATFYENVARLAAGRIRSLTEGAVAGVFGKDTPQVADVDQLEEWLGRIVDAIKFSLPPAETALRRDPDDPQAKHTLKTALEQLEREVESLFEATRDPRARQFATELLSRELHPYLVRSALAERSVRRPQGVVGTAEVLTHVLVDTAGGDGRLGELIDRWLLDRPTFRALRALKEPLVETVRAHLPHHRNRRVLLLNAGTGSLVVRLCEVLGHPPTVLTVLDQSRDALALVDVGAGSRGVELVTMVQDLPRFAIGRGSVELPPQDAVVLHGLLEYLPDRMVVSLLGVIRERLTPEGFVVVALPGPSPDRVLLDRLLAWPTLRRSPETLQGLFEAAGLCAEQWVPLPAPAQLPLLRRSAVAPRESEQ
jgi:extracellular factor (EF) 3-hydroxypalmitic acid methyl ester biosynthesis protein